MSVTYPPIGNRVVAKIIHSENDCTIGMKPGDEFELSVHRCGEFCGMFYKNIAQWVATLQFDGTFPVGDDPDVQVWECPNANNRVKVELRRIRD